MPDAARLAEMIAGDFYDGRLDLSARGMAPGAAWLQMPEVECVRQLRSFGKPDRLVRLFLTFVSAMDRARDATRLWRAGVKLLESHPEVFEPAEVSAMCSDKVRDLLSAHDVSRRHGPDTKAWRIIAGSLASGRGAVYRVVDSGVGDAKELLGELRSVDDNRQSRFPMLRGPKVGPMWVRIMANPGGAEISRIDIIPVAVDVQVRRTTENLGVTDTMGLRLKEAKPLIQSVWRTAVADAGIGGPPGIADSSAALDPALWFFGKYGCSHCERMDRRVPIGRACDHCQFQVSPRTSVGKQSQGR